MGDEDDSQVTVKMTGLDPYMKQNDFNALSPEQRKEIARMINAQTELNKCLKDVLIEALKGRMEYSDKMQTTLEKISDKLGLLREIASSSIDQDNPRVIKNALKDINDLLDTSKDSDGTLEKELRDKWQTCSLSFEDDDDDDDDHKNYNRNLFSAGSILKSELPESKLKNTDDPSSSVSDNKKSVNLNNNSKSNKNNKADNQDSKQSESRSRSKSGCNGKNGDDRDNDKKKRGNNDKNSKKKDKRNNQSDSDESSSSSADDSDEEDIRKFAKAMSKGKPAKLSTNTPTFSAAKNEKLDDWIFVVNNAFKSAKIKKSKDKLMQISTYVKNPVLQTLKRYQKDEERPTWKGFCEILRELYDPKNQIWKLRSQLKNLKMTDSFDKYLRRFQELINLIPGLSKEDEMANFIDGLAENYKFEVLSKKCETLNEAIEIASNLDFCSKNQAIEVNRIKKVNNMNFQRKPNPSKPQSFWKRLVPNKFKGGYKDKQDMSKIKCYTCNKMGHYSKTCYSKKKASKPSDHIKNPRAKDSNHPHKVMSINANGSAESLLCVTGKVNGIPMKLFLDSGATASIMSHSAATKYNFNILPSNVQVKVADNMVVDVVGVTDPVTIEVQGHSCTLELFIMEHDDHEVLLGLNWFIATGAGIFPGEGILRFKGESIYLENQEKVYDNESYEEIMMSEVATSNEDEDIEIETNWAMLDKDEALKNMVPVEMLSPHQQRKFDELKLFVRERFAFSYLDLGTCIVQKHKIRTMNDEIIFLYPYRKSMKEREEINAEILSMLEAGIIRPSTSAWSSPVVIIPKKDGSKRMCVDYRKLNAITIQENWPLPDIRDILDRLNGSVWFSCLDLKAGYWQMPLDEDSIQKTAFSTPDGHYEFLKLPFGLKNAPAFFSRVMHRVLGHLKFVEIYLDDITIHSKTFDEHIEHIKTVFRELKKASLKVNSSKCTWCASSIKLLGHIVSKDSVAMDPAKIQAIKERLPPKNVKQVQQYLGICNYYRRFIKDFSKIAKPLFGLLQKDKKWDWTPECQAAFEGLRDKLVQYPILRHPDYKKPFMLHTDASGFAIGAILSQRDENGEYVCSYASRILRGAELHYGITEKECLAVVFGVKQFRIYLYGTKFEIITDHSALAWLMGIKEPSGKSHSNVDALSRPVLACSILISEDTDSSVKDLDPYENEGLLYFLTHRKHLEGQSRNQVRRIDNNIDHYKLVKDTIYYRKDVKSDDFKLIPKLEDRYNIVLNAHLLGHFQFQSTLDRVKEKYYWRKMDKDVENVIKKCLTCQRHQLVPEINHKANAIPITGIFDLIGIDLVFGLPETNEGYHGIMVVTEYLSKYPYAVPIKSKSAEEISSQLFKYISMFGPPKCMLSDQGNEFNNKLVKSLLETAGTEHKVTSAYNPRTNGQTERFNQTLINSLRKHCEANPNDWHLWLPYILLAYRSRVHTSTGFTPFEIVFGRKMNTFDDYKNNKSNDEIGSLLNRSYEIKELVELLQPTAKESIINSQEKQVKIQNDNHKISHEVLKPGTMVLIKAEGILPKLSPRYRGPYKVTKSTSVGNYVLENAIGEPIEMTYPRHKLKVVADQQEEDYETFEIEKILEFKK
jgi:hypothetical protein